MAAGKLDHPFDRCVGRYDAGVAWELTGIAVCPEGKLR